MNLKSEKITKTDELQKQKLITILQNNNNYSEAIAIIENEITKSKEITSFEYELRCFKNDGVYQLNKAIEEVCGFSQAKADDSPSGSKTIETIDVTLSDGSRHKVPYGKIQLPNLGETAYIDIHYTTFYNQLIIEGECEFRFSHIIDSIINKTKELISTNSIYSNLAIEIENVEAEPKIMDLSNIDKELMVLNKSTQYDLQPLQSRILYPETCIEKGIPLKYGCLLEGVYGTGKTLLAFKLAKQAIGNKWTFIYLKNPNQLATVLKIAKEMDKSGHGVIIFTEDIDQVTRGNRNDAMQNILNTLDGGDTKGMNVIALFTTNHIELIEPTFLRGKRIGSIVSMGYLDKETADEFIKLSFDKNIYKLESDISEITELIEKSNIVPAFMAEIIESVKSKMIFLNTNEVKNEYFKYSIQSYMRQVNLSQKKDMSETNEMKLANSLRELLDVEKLTEIKSKCDEIYSEV